MQVLAPSWPHSAADRAILERASGTVAVLPPRIVDELGGSKARLAPLASSESRSEVSTVLGLPGVRTWTGRLGSRSCERIKSIWKIEHDGYRQYFISRFHLQYLYRRKKENKKERKKDKSFNFMKTRFIHRAV